MNTIEETDSERLRQLHQTTRKRIASDVEQVLAERIASITDITSPEAARLLHDIEEMESERFFQALKGNTELAHWIYGDDWQATIERIGYWHKDEAERLEEDYKKSLQAWQEKPLSIKERLIDPLCWWVTGIAYGILGGIIVMGFWG